MTTDQTHRRRYGFWSTLAVFVAIRVLVNIVAYTAPQDRHRAGAPEWWSDVPLLRWDAGHYSYILQAGYPLVDGKLPAWPKSDSVAFFPLYPLMTRPLLAWFRPEMALIVSAHLASTLALVFVYLWARKRYNPRVAFWCVLVLSAYPPAMFFSSGYADGLLVLWVALALWLLEYRWIWTAALVCGLASATRPTGVALSAVFMLWVLLNGPRQPWPRRVARLTALGLVSISGLLVFQLYLWQHYGRPDAFAAVQSNWGANRPASHPVLRIISLKPVIQPALAPLKYAIRGDWDRLTTAWRWNALLNVIIVALAVAGLIRPGPIPRVYYLLAVFVFLMAWLPDPYRGDRMVGIARYQLMALPSFLLLAAWMTARWPAWLRTGFCAVWLAMQCMYVRDFVNWELAS